MMRTRICLSLAGIMLLAFELPHVQGSEQEFIKIMQGAPRIIAATPEKSANLHEEGSVGVRLDRAFRGRGAKGEQLVVAHDGSESTVSLDEGQSYLMLLRPNTEIDGWVYLGAAVMPFRDGAFQISGVGDQGDAVAVSLEQMLGLIDHFAFDPQTAHSSRQTLGGRWALIITTEKGENSREKVDAPLWVVDVDTDGGKHEAKVLAMADEFKESQFSEFAVDGDSVQFTVEVTAEKGGAQHQFKFEGRFENGLVRGNMTADAGLARVAELRATSAMTMEQTGERKSPVGWDELESASEAEDEFVAYQQFVKDYADSPSVLDGYLRLLTSESVVRLEEQELRELAESYLAASQKWGDRIYQKAVLEVALAISGQKSHPHLALELLNKIESNLTESSPQTWREALALQRPLMEWEAADREKAVTMLKEFRKAHPFNPFGTYHLARMYEQQNKIDEALKLYTELVALPNMQNMVENAFQSQTDFVPLLNKLDELWKSKHGTRKGLPLFSIQVYYSAIENYTDERLEPREQKPGAPNRVALMELLTGTKCPTCVAADLASGIMEHVYPKNDLIVLRYHLHNAGPDPMAAPPSNERFKYYEGRGIPTMAINGKKIQGGGYIVHIPEMLRAYRKEVDDVLDDVTDVELKLSARFNVEDKAINISAEANRPDAFGEDLRLKIVLAEARLVHSATNGVLLHEQVVRKMVGGHEGIAPTDGKLEFQGAVNLLEYHAELEKYMTDFEDMVGNQTGEPFRFDFRPLVPLRLNVIAFVQNEKTKEVLQATIIPVEVPEEEHKHDHDHPHGDDHDHEHKHDKKVQKEQKK